MLYGRPDRAELHVTAFSMREPHRPTGHQRMLTLAVWALPR
jgi:hypothetical protein